jgi:prepilin-type N-terminal cleavage/methylation domain-containing protein
MATTVVMCESRKVQRGFTLLEQLVVIVVTSGFVALLWPVAKPNGPVHTINA